MRTLALVLAALCLATPALADPCKAPLPKKHMTFSGIVTYIGDGDSLCIGEDQGGIEVRVADFRAAEINDPGGRDAKKALSEIALGKQVTCVADHRSWDRIVAVCTLDGKSIGDLMREKGVLEGGE